jgi:hypothetical protein
VHHDEADASTNCLSTSSPPRHFSGDDKLMLAALFAFQLLRGPRWKEAYEDRTRGFLEEYDRTNMRALTDQEVEEHNAQLVSDTHRLGMMLSTGVTGTAVFASMH